MPAPTFIGIGSAKAGTTWLAHALAQHPDVLFGRRKELLYYGRPDLNAHGREWYEGQFTDGRPDAPAVGEFTPRYLHTAPLVRPDPLTTRPSWPDPHKVLYHWPGVAERVAADYGPKTGHDLKLVVVLRDPVARAKSDCRHNVRHGFVPPTASVYEAACHRPAVIEHSYYARNLERWLDLFPHESFLFLVYEEDVRPDEAKPQTLRRVYEHIGVDPTFVPEDIDAERNVGISSFHLRRRAAHPLLSRAMALVPRALRDHPVWDLPVPLNEDDRLAEEFAPDIEYVERLLGRPTPWRRPAKTARFVS